MGDRRQNLRINCAGGRIKTRLKLALIGFVFIIIVHGSLFVVHCYDRGYRDFWSFRIGFVLHNLYILIDWAVPEMSQDNFSVPRRLAMICSPLVIINHPDN